MTRGRYRDPESRAKALPKSLVHGRPRARTSLYDKAHNFQMAFAIPKSLVLELERLCIA